MKTRKALESIGTYHAGKKKTGAVKLSSNENPLGTSPEALWAIRENLEDLNIYPDPVAGELKAALAAAYGLSADQIIVGNGSDDIMTLIAGAYVEEGRNVVTSAHTFSVYTLTCQLFGGEMRCASMKDGSHDLDAMLELIDANTAAVFICNPNNPTGRYVSHGTLLDFLEKAPAETLIVLDEAYADYATASDFPDALSLLPGFKNLMILRTFSKIYGLAGLRVGFGCGDPGIIANLYKVKAPFNVNSLAQTAALGALEDTDFLDKSIRNNEEGKEYLYREIEALGLACHPTEANFICIDMGRDALGAFNRIMELGVTVRALHSFGMPNWIRVTVGTPEQNRLFIDCLKTYLEEAG